MKGSKPFKSSFVLLTITKSHNRALNSEVIEILGYLRPRDNSVVEKIIQARYHITHQENHHLKGSKLFKRSFILLTTTKSHNIAQNYRIFNSEKAIPLSRKYFNQVIMSCPENLDVKQIHFNAIWVFVEHVLSNQQYEKNFNCVCC